MDTNAPLSERLRAIPLFEGLSHAERQKLVTHFEPVQFEGGARLCTEGSAGEALFILESGCVRVHKATQGDIEEEIAVLESGAVFGEVAVLDGRPCSATITALGPVRAYRLDNGDILRMRLSFEPALFKAFGNLTSTLCERLRAVNGRIGALMSQPELGGLMTEFTVGGQPYRTIGVFRTTGHEADRDVHLALNSGLPLVDPTGGYYFVFQAGLPMFRKYDADGRLLFERHIEGPELDAMTQAMPNTWPRHPDETGRELPLIPPTVRAAAVASNGDLWVSLRVPYTYVYGQNGEKVRTVQFQAAGTVSPDSFFFDSRDRLLVTPGCYIFTVS